ncbi:MAG: type II toxin-antitoxin system VapC family toxin [Anaerolineae bacterium]|nr:type II toxin-antitoxin system VapC family toxin [Anaerolineae bacterium]
MAILVLDSGVLIARSYNEPVSQDVEAMLTRIRTREVELHAPILFKYELVSVVRKPVHSPRVTPLEGGRLLDELLQYPVTLHFDDALLRRGFELAGELTQPRAYDGQYLALAERLQCEFWTTDERLFNSVRSAFPLIRWLGNVDING